MVRIGEQPGAASIARKEQCPSWCTGGHATRGGQCGAEVCIGREVVAYLQAHHLPHPHMLTHGDRAGTGVAAHHAADKEVALLVFGAVLIDDDAGKHSVFHQATLICRKGLDDLADTFECRATCELPDDALAPVGDGHLGANGAAALRHEGRDAREGNPHRAGVGHPLVEDEAVLAWGLTTRGHTSGHLACHPCAIRSGKRIGWEAERIGQQDHRLVSLQIEGCGGVDGRGPAHHHQSPIGCLTRVEDE